MKFVIKRPRLVEEDLLAAALWYDSQQPGLGDHFLDESESVINSLPERALWHAIRFADERCVRLPRFKRYGIFYVIRETEIILLAIHHGHRDPGWLRERRKELD